MLSFDYFQTLRPPFISFHFKSKRNLRICSEKRNEIEESSSVKRTTRGEWRPENSSCVSLFFLYYWSMMMLDNGLSSCFPTTGLELRMRLKKSMASYASLQPIKNVYVSNGGNYFSYPALHSGMFHPDTILTVVLRCRDSVQHSTSRFKKRQNFD